VVCGDFSVIDVGPELMLLGAVKDKVCRAFPGQWQGAHLAVFDCQ